MSSIESVPIVLLQGLGISLFVFGAMIAMANASALKWWAILKACGIAFVAALAAIIVSPFVVLVLWGIIGDESVVYHEDYILILVTGGLFVMAAFSSLRSVSDGYWKHCLVLIAFIVGPTLVMLDYSGIILGVAALITMATIGMAQRRSSREDEEMGDI